MVTFNRTYLPDQIKYNNKVYVYGQKTDKSIRVMISTRRERKQADLRGEPYLARAHYYNPLETI